MLTKLSTNVYRAHFGASVYIDTSAIAVAGQWIHLAVSRDGSTGSLFVDGIRQATTSSVVNFSDGTDPLVFGERNSGGQTFPFNGYISNARIVKGTYVYNPSSTSITVPTSFLTAITNTVFLGLQSNRYIDNSSNNATATASTASSVQLFNPFTRTNYYQPSVIGGSAYFDGTGDYLQTPSSSAFNFSATDCTLEFWYYGAGSGGLVFEFGSSAPDTAAMQCEFSSGTLTFKPIGASSSFFAIQRNAWNYIAAVKTGTTYYLYINGTRNTSSTGTAASSGQIINIGARNGGSVAPITGYLSDFRVSNTARYTGTTMTVPTTPSTAIANTQLMLNYTNAAVLDNAMMNDLETVGNAQISTSVKKYGSASMYFDGSGDYLYSIANQTNNFGTGNFTIECWVYFASVGNAQLVSAGPGSNTNAYYWQYYSSQLQFGIQNVGGITATSWTPIANTWYHLAVVRSGTSVYQFVNGTQLGSTATSSQNFVDGPTYVGYGGAGYLNGYIDDLRITKVARYTANFQPPTSQLQDQ